MFQHILLAADGSKHSERAAEKAISIAKLVKNSKITLIQVIDELPSNFKMLDEEMIPQKVTNEQKEKIYTIETSVRKAGITIEVKHLLGEPGPTIVREANDNDYDLVVIGSRGLNQFQQMVLGSVSHKVAKRVKVPVMIIK
ncbi:universal stress protein [Bacillus shivajii]|uniref:universal stress protein n=1 Tax=Bacillus shivajii TaxID=1983719 RepID=UPI001CFACF64|nr:universal stress protein [Bacillus shivajii]UCZ51489.1 universal stress protein [Bacillus shivajii]